MAIRGSLSEASLADVLQLLALGQKTGCLSIAREGSFGSVHFVSAASCLRASSIAATSWVIAWCAAAR
jgi:hypothetical protein